MYKGVGFALLIYLIFLKKKHGNEIIWSERDQIVSFKKRGWGGGSHEPPEPPMYPPLQTLKDTDQTTTFSSRLFTIIGIKHVFQCINICWTPRVVLKSEPERQGF